MVDWNKISSKEFENLAYMYVTSKYPEVNWESTKRTRDGNRDGEACYIAPLNTTIKYWYEAKYSKTHNKSIPKSHLDSTLVSCLLEGKVVLLAFITNAYISEDYRRRADIFSKQRDNLNIIYINGDELEDWLYDNPEIETRFFSTKVAVRQDLIDYVETAYILQNYDMCGNQFAKARSLENGKDYVLYLSFYSKRTQKIVLVSDNTTIKLLNADNRKYDQYDCLYSKAGFNSFFLPIGIFGKSNEPLRFTLMGDNKIEFTVENIPILNIYNPKIIYRSQIEISNNLFSVIQDRDISNALYFIIGDGGSGKTYLLNDLYHNSLTPFSSFVFSFTGDEVNDSLNCYRLIIASLYGDIWNCYTNNEYFVQFNEVESSMIEQIVNNQLNEMLVNQIILYYKNNHSQIERQSSQIQIFIDDFHKLSSKLITLMEVFFDWTIKQRYNCKFFVFTRPEKVPLETYTRKYEIKGLEHDDVEATVLYNFKDNPYLSRIIRKYPLPLNVLHFLNLLCNIHEVEKEFINKTELETQILLNKIFSESNETTCLSLGKQIIANYRNNALVYCIYKIKTGVPFAAIIEFWGISSQDEIYELCQKRILKESSDIIFPYHDILVSAFNSFSIKEMNELLERFVLFAEQKHYVSKSKMFSVLLKIGKKCFWKYRSAARIYRDELHASADYAQALEIALNLKDATQKRLDDYDVEDCKNQFVLANCIKYTESYERANNEFQKIIDIYRNTHNSEVYGLYLEAETEIINNLIWMLDVKLAKKKLLELSSVFEDLYAQNQVCGKNLTYAFLNYYNRSMFVGYMLGSGSEIEYQKALEFALILNQPQYVAFAKLDFAKCLYGKDLFQASILVEEALDILTNCNEKRRTLDALSEKCFINDLINHTISFDVYSDLKSKMQRHHYIQSEVKLDLKMVLLRLLYGKTSSCEIRNLLDAISINNSTIGSGKRHQAFINHLYAATYYRENDLLMSRKYTLKCLNLMKNMGDSYQYVHLNNAELKTFSGFLSLNEIQNVEIPINSFVIDIRIW